MNNLKTVFFCNIDRDHTVKVDGHMVKKGGKPQPNKTIEQDGLRIVFLDQCDPDGQFRIDSLHVDAKSELFSLPSITCAILGRKQPVAIEVA